MTARRVLATIAALLASVTVLLLGRTTPTTAQHSNKSLVNLSAIDANGAVRYEHDDNVLVHGDATSGRASQRPTVASPVQLMLPTGASPPSHARERRPARPEMYDGTRVFPSLVAHTHQQRMVPPLSRLLERPSSVGDAISDAFRGEYGWRFLEYIPSTLEASFLADMRARAAAHDTSDYSVELYRERAERLLRVSKGRVMSNQMPDDVHGALLQCDRDDAEAVGGAGRARVVNPQCYEPPTRDTIDDIDNVTLSQELLSRFIYEFVCLGPPCDETTLPSATNGNGGGPHLGERHTSWIEPLFGALRHPSFLLDHGQRKYLEDKGYMMPDRWALHNLHTRYRRQGVHDNTIDPHGVPSQGTRHLTNAASIHRHPPSLFVDMGASTYGAGTGGASQNWFVGGAACLCVPFTEMFLFEAKRHKASSVWRHVPDTLHPGYHWYNYALNASVHSWRNPLNHLLTKMHPNDVVTVKVDFDTPILEAEIIDTILRFPELYQVIDELYYEHHVSMPYMTAYWRERAEHLTIVDSIELFQALRRKGIRAHSWV